jgi:hypothetical protein
VLVPSLALEFAEQKVRELVGGEKIRISPIAVFPEKPQFSR